jgi:tetratricopeptide (TPR) repeat protein
LSLLRRIDFDEYGDTEGKYRLYHFHPSVRNYLEHKVQHEEQNNRQQELEQMYGNEFSLYYYKLPTETSHTIGKKDHVLSIERFNVIWQGKDNDFDRAIRLAKDRWMASYSSSFLGSILRMLGRYNVALEYHKIALSIDEELNDKIAMAKDYNNIGLVLHYQGNFDLALQYYKKALEANEKLQNRDGIAEAYVNIAIVLGGVHRNFGQALEYLKKALSIYEDLQDKVKISGTYGSIGRAFFHAPSR